MNHCSCVRGFVARVIPYFYLRSIPSFPIIYAHVSPSLVLHSGPKTGTTVIYIYIYVSIYVNICRITVYHFHCFWACYTGHKYICTYRPFGHFALLKIPNGQGKSWNVIELNEQWLYVTLQRKLYVYVYNIRVCIWFTHIYIYIYTHIFLLLIFTTIFILLSIFIQIVR